MLDTDDEYQLLSINVGSITLMNTWRTDPEASGIQ